jgi:hypothetical protein
MGSLFELAPSGDKNYYTQFRSLSLLKNSPPFAFYTTGDLFFIA